MNAFRLLSLGVIIFTLNGCGEIKAGRAFNRGVAHFERNDFEAAVRSFKRADEQLVDPAVRYNLALAYLALIRDASSGDQSAAVESQQVSDALAAVAAARELPGLTSAMLAKLGYIEGSIHVHAKDEEAARRAFAQSLEANPNFKLTLKALLELDAESEVLARFVLATTNVEALKPEVRPRR